MPVEHQILIIFAATQKYLLDIPTADVLRFQDALIELVETKYSEVTQSIRDTKALSDEMKDKLVQAIEECKKNYK